MHGLILAQVGSLAYPITAAAGAAAITIPIVIHLLTRLRRRPVPWAAMRFLIEAQRRYRHRRRLEEWLLLLMRCMIPLLLGLALSGPLLRGDAIGRLFAGAAGNAGRLVCVVIDDSLSTHAADASGNTLFEQLQDTALAVLDGLSGDDRLVVWRAGRPAEAVYALDAFDHDAARGAIEAMQPRYSASDMVQAMSLAKAAVDQHARPGQQAWVVLVSDFANGALPVERPAPAQLLPWGERVKLLVARPKLTQPNVQVSRLEPQQTLVLPSPLTARPSVSVQVHLRRFGGDALPGTSRVELSAYETPGAAAIATVRHDHRWQPGQTEAVIQSQVPLFTPDDSTSGGSWPASQDGGRLVAIRARLESAAPEPGRDAIEPDNLAWAVVERRDRLRVGLLAPTDTAGWDDQRSAISLPPSRWVRLALQPGWVPSPTAIAGAGRIAGLIDTVDLEPTSLDAGAMKTLDAVMVIRPDLLAPSAWVVIKEFVERGGLAWVFVPQDVLPTAWSAALRDQLGLDWQVGVEPRVTKTAGRQGVTLDTDHPAPPSLSLLSADWQQLLAPVRVDKLFDLTPVGNAAASTESVWLRTIDASPLLVSAQLGRGRVLLWGTALDVGWTNLPTKPLFVPLLHEALRGGLTDSGVARQGQHVAGQAPTLDWKWSEARELTLDDPTQPHALSVRVNQTQQGPQLVGALQQPGIYTAAPASTGLMLAVNPDAQAGDTRSISAPGLEAWLSSLGPWQWLDAQRPASALATQPQWASLAWPLLWVVLGLLLCEMALARWFSHATDSTAWQWWGGRLKSAWRTLKAARP